ncbi:response regulator [Chrysiogenes arsenatis]|uniref:response regulator n=1 Tax=Chrysiogenes arsenatis TaxID=309797 RepID=UPI00041A065E|nr:response regulator [Chrysiogenes arsenatis]
MHVQGEPIVILLAEDDPAHAEIVRRNLETAQVANRLVHVVDGLEALDYLYQREKYSDPTLAPRPGLVLLDLRMPKVDGLEVLRTIKADSSLCSIPTVILTTSSAEIDIAKAYECNANSYLVKPVHFAQFVELIQALGYYWLIWNRTNR